VVELRRRDPARVYLVGDSGGAAGAEMRFFDPPSGWRYGFPQEYRPEPGETLAQTLMRNGYPAKDAEWASEHTRFWDQPDDREEREKIMLDRLRGQG